MERIFSQLRSRHRIEWWKMRFQFNTLKVRIFNWRFCSLARANIEIRFLNFFLNFILCFGRKNFCRRKKSWMEKLSQITSHRFNIVLNCFQFFFFQITNRFSERRRQKVFYLDIKKKNYTEIVYLQCLNALHWIERSIC